MSQLCYTLGDRCYYDQCGFHTYNSSHLYAVSASWSVAFPTRSPRSAHGQPVDYLGDLRSNRTPRPHGSRPLPSSVVRRRVERIPSSSPDAAPTARPLLFSSATEPALVPSYRQIPQSSSCVHSAATGVDKPGAGFGRPLMKQPGVAVAEERTLSLTPEHGITAGTYIESEQRRMERQEAHPLRRILQDMNPHDEQRLHNAAQDEASELIWKHQNADAPYRSPDTPYAYGGQLRKGNHVRNRSWSGTSQESGRSRSQNRRGTSATSSRSASAGSGSNNSQSRRVLSDVSLPLINDFGSAPEKDCDTAECKEEERLGIRLHADVIVPALRVNSQKRGQSSGARRRTSGQHATSPFRNPDNKIYKEHEQSVIPPVPTDEVPSKSAPQQFRRNPFSRAQLAKDLGEVKTEPLITTGKFARYRFQQDPDPNSHNSTYTSGPPRLSRLEEFIDAEIVEKVRKKGGLEIRSDEIRAATSMRKSDRSPNLPVPTIVSDSPTRPIVSFQPGWKPKAIELKEEQSRAPLLRNSPQTGARLDTLAPVNDDLSIRCVPVIKFPETEVTNGNDSSSLPVVEASLVASYVPVIQIDRSHSTPSIRIREAPNTMVTALAADGEPASSSTTNRPLPNPGRIPFRPYLRHATTTPAVSAPHWTPATRRATALCAYCARPIAGRIVSAAGSRFHPDCFVCHHCGEGLECVAFYPEPDDKRSERVDRIRRHMTGGDYPTCEGVTEENDGDEGLRFYCHLDFHEFFSPRCKSCKTPIEGEVVVACGAEWHVGHFFCAQCGDVSGFLHKPLLIAGEL